DGTVVTLTATANPGSTFTAWGGACSGTGTCTVTLDQARSVTATFTQNAFGSCGEPHFRPHADFAAGFGPAAVAVGDFNGDGRPDLAVANDLQDSVSVLLGAGDGTFAPRAMLDVGTAPVAIAVGDFNGDGNADLVTPNAGDDTVSLLLGAGDGSFAAHA